MHCVDLCLWLTIVITYYCILILPTVVFVIVTICIHVFILPTVVFVVVTICIPYMCLYCLLIAFILAFLYNIVCEVVLGSTC